jgi:hypothetical protein
MAIPDPQHFPSTHNGDDFTCMKQMNKFQILILLKAFFRIKRVNVNWFNQSCSIRINQLFPQQYQELL